jgi:hypothetical protein
MLTNQPSLSTDMYPSISNIKSSECKQDMYPSISNIKSSECKQ